MPVCPVLATDAPWSSSGCLCRDRSRAYPSDLTDGQWSVPEPRARAVMAELARCTGRPMVHDLRAVLDAIACVVRYGIEWRALPVDFPPHEAVYAFLCRWSQRGLPEQLADQMRERIRVDQGRSPRPSAAVIDSQSVKASDAVPAARCGYDAGKKIKGRKRHIAVHMLGLVVSVLVTAASAQDREAGMRLTSLVREKFSTVALVWADRGYAGRLVEWAFGASRLRVEIVKRSDDVKGFQVPPRRWVVERTFGWLVRYRGLGGCGAEPVWCAGVELGGFTG
jgi:transposase